jgi:hypothetical protein
MFQMPFVVVCFYPRSFLQCLHARPYILAPVVYTAFTASKILSEKAVYFSRFSIPWSVSHFHAMSFEEDDKLDFEFE